MSRRAIRLAAFLALILAACTGDSAQTQSPAASIDLVTTTTVTSVAITEVPTTHATAPSGAERLVVVNSEGDIVTLDPDGSNPTQLTDKGPTARYFQPVWSPVSDHLVWGEASGPGFGVGSSAGDGSDPHLVPTSSLPFYLSWSPDGSQVGILYGGMQGVVLEVVDMESHTASPIGSGSPFYFSWDPGSTNMAVHVGANAFGTIALGEGLIDLGGTTAVYQAPHWTPVGIVHFGDEGLTLVDPVGDADRLLATLSGEPVIFVANPQGTKVAVESFFAEEGDGSTVALVPAAQIDSNTVSVLDMSTGVVDVALEETSVGYFWSPDGESLLLLRLTDGTGEVEVSVWKAGETTSVTTMTLPISYFREVLPFFNQYAQSIQLWSPDSSRLALPGTIGGESGIWVLSTDGSQPSLVSDGEWVSWSHG